MLLTFTQHLEDATNRSPNYNALINIYIYFSQKKDVKSPAHVIQKSTNEN